MKQTFQRRIFIQRLLTFGIIGALPPEATRMMAAARKTEDSPLTVLFQGDSITDGGRQREGSDLNHMMGQSYPYLVSGRLGYDHPQPQTTFVNRGISGNTVDDLLGRWQTDAIDLRPDVISILIGVNDLDRFMQGAKEHSADRFEASYRALLTMTREKLPKTRLVLLEPFIFPVGRIGDNWTRYSTELLVRQKIVRRLASDFDTRFIPLQDVFNEKLSHPSAAYWIWDGIHPTPAGHELLAREWVRSFMKFKP